MRLPSSIALVAAILAGVMSASCAARTAPAAPVVTPGGVRFVLMRSEARSVALAGNFNQWSAASHPLAREKSRGLWTIVVALPPGEHLFMYVVDGTEWISPPFAEDYVDDAFGARNGVVIVRQ
jgi:1,4-alpha-glucan branching enzyme